MIVKYMEIVKKTYPVNWTVSHHFQIILLDETQNNLVYKLNKTYV